MSKRKHAPKFASMRTWNWNLVGLGVHLPFRPQPAEAQLPWNYSFVC